MSGAMIAAFGGISLLFIVTPGADWAYAISGGLRQRVVPAVSGLLLGHVVIIAVVAAGVGAVIQRFPVALTVLTLAGAVYLLWLGWRVLWSASASEVVASAGMDAGARRWMMRGVGVSGLNPKVFLLTLAVLPQFTSAAAPWPVGIQVGALGALHVVTCAIVYFAVGFAAARVLGSRPAAARIITRVSGFAMFGIGVLLIAERVATLVATGAIG